MLLNPIAVTRTANHFYGYYDKCPFDRSDSHVLGLRCDVIARLQRPTDRATIGVIELDCCNAWRPIAETGSWNWQMGAMAEWLPGRENTVIHNDRRKDAFVSVITDIESGDQTTLPTPFFEVAPDGESALTLNFSRLWDVRPETGYCGIPDPWYLILDENFLNRLSNAAWEARVSMGEYVRQAINEKLGDSDDS